MAYWLSCVNFLETPVALRLALRLVEGDVSLLTLHLLIFPDLEHCLLLVVG